MVNKQRYNGIGLSPPQYIKVNTAGGGIEKVQIFKDAITDSLLLQCTQCYEYISYRNDSERTYLSHRGGNQCRRNQNANLRRQNENEVQEALRTQGFDQLQVPEPSSMLIFVLI